MKSEYRRRTISDGNVTDLYRFTTAPSKNIFAVYSENQLITIGKYDSISDRWGTFCNIKMMSINEQKNFGVVIAENKMFVVGGCKGETYVRTVSYIPFIYVGASAHCIWSEKLSGSRDADLFTSFAEFLIISSSYHYEIQHTYGSMANDLYDFGHFCRFR